MKIFTSIKTICSMLILGHVCHPVVAQVNSDSIFLLGAKVITLREVVVNTGLNVPVFIKRIQEDSSFYKAFKNLRLLSYSAINDIRILGKKDALLASLHSTTRQTRIGNCRTMAVLNEATTGPFYTDVGEYNWYTAALYASLFFTKDTICGETNVMGNQAFSISDKSGIEKHKAQLKMLFFNPGKRIQGLPFMSNKTEIFADELADAYDMSIDRQEFNRQNCVVFHQKVKPGYEDRVVVDEMKTWFNDSTFEVEKRDYSLSYDAGVYDFKVSMEVQMTKVNGLNVPSLIRYYGNWKALFKKRERGVFTITLFDIE